MKKSLFVMMLCGIVALIAGCSKKQDKALVVATNPTFPPYEFMIGQDIVGIDIDICAEVAKKLGCPMRVENTEFASIITHVITGKASVGASGITVTEDRKKQVLFSDPYFRAAQVIIVLKSNEKIKTAADLKGMRIGCQHGTTGYDFVRKNIVTEKNSQLLQAFDNPGLAIEAMKAGKLDAVVCDEGPANTFGRIDKNLAVLATPLTSEEYAMAFNKKDTELCKAFNEVIAELKVSGRLNEIEAKNKAMADKQGK